MIPLVGGIMAGVPSVVLALLHSPTAGVVALVVFIGFQLVENHFIYPVVMSRAVRMNPLWVLLAVLVGANIGGVFGSTLGALTGALVAIPVGGAIQVVVREMWERSQAVPAAATWGDATGWATGDRRPGGSGRRRPRSAEAREGGPTEGDRADTVGGRPVP